MLNVRQTRAGFLVVLSDCPSKPNGDHHIKKKDEELGSSVLVGTIHANCFASDTLTQLTAG